jgi:hypothetical protein
MSGQIAYEAYRSDAGGKSLATGQPIPEWDGLKSEIQHAWEAAAKAVVRAEEMPELPCCPPHEQMLKNGTTQPFDNCIVCIRNERDELRMQLADALAGQAEQYRAAHEAERQLAEARTALRKIAALDYANAAANCCAYDAHQIANAAIDAIKEPKC